MSGVVSVLSKINNLGNALRSILPNLAFKEIISEVDYDQLYKSEIIIADFDLINPHLKYLKHTKWIQGTWAGVDKLIPYLNQENTHSFIITRFSGLHFGRIMSEYVVTNIVNYERNLFGAYENKKQKIWSQKDKITEYRCISDLTIGILGIGTIGKHISQTLHSLGATLWGFGRKENLPNTEEYKHFQQYCTIYTLPQLLQKCDYIINVLPDTPETKGLLNGDLLQICEGTNTVFMNIGRGSIIKEENLIEAVKNKWITAAILDVFASEPLSSESMLWNFDQVFITPHSAGVSRAKDIAEQFSINFELFKNGQSIPTQLHKGRDY